jgi:hypothetical protein
MENSEPKLIGDDTNSKKIRQLPIFNMELNFLPKTKNIVEARHNGRIFK